MEPEMDPENSPEEPPSWWKRHYLPDDDLGGKFNSPFYKHNSGAQSARAFYPAGGGFQNVDPEYLMVPVKGPKGSRPKLPKNDVNAQQVKRLQRMTQYKSLVSRMRENDTLAKQYTGETFHSMELMHPNFWFTTDDVIDSEADVIDHVTADNDAIDSFWVNKHLYMKSSRPIKPKYGRDELLTVRLAREAKDMNSRMSNLYDSEKLKLLEMESELELNKERIEKLERELNKAEETSRIFEKTFTQANTSVLNKLKSTSSDMKLLNSRLLLNPGPNYSGLLPALVLPEQKYLIRTATDPIWERTRLFLESEKDKEREELLERAYSNTFR